jgi:hypothetical protein
VALPASSVVSGARLVPSGHLFHRQPHLALQRREAHMWPGGKCMVSSPNQAVPVVLSQVPIPCAERPLDLRSNTYKTQLFDTTKFPLIPPQQAPGTSRAWLSAFWFLAEVSTGRGPAPSRAPCKKTQGVPTPIRVPCTGQGNGRSPVPAGAMVLVVVVASTSESASYSRQHSLGALTPL